jgi:flagellar basal body-associated protein FliL
MSEVPEPSPRRKLIVRIFLVLFVASALFMSWFGMKQQQAHGPKSDGKAKDPYEDRSLFGR